LVAKRKKTTIFNYFWQLIFAGIFIYCVLILFKDTNQMDVLWALGVSSLASSVFIVFTSPESSSAKEGRILSAYFINMAMGAITHYALQFTFGPHLMLSPANFVLFSAFATLAVILSILFMVIFDVKHPPAVGICIILVIDMQRYYIIAVISISALILALLHLMLRRWLRNL
jgi:hypothetical protein